MTAMLPAILTGLLFSLICLRHAGRLKQETVRLRRWQEITEQLSLLLREGTMGLTEVLSACADGDTPADALLQRLAADMTQQPLAECSVLYDALTEPCTEKALLLRMFTRLCWGSLESRSLAAAQASESLALMADRAGQKSAVDSRLWQRLGVIGGACVTLLLI